MGKGMHSFFIVLILVLLSGCVGQSPSPQASSSEQTSPHKITQVELAELIQENEELLLVDVRTKGEYNEGHLPGAIVIPYNEFDTRNSDLVEYRDRAIVLYCHTGGMGDYAGRVLLKNGFTNVRNLDGGINGWINSGGNIL